MMMALQGEREIRASAEDGHTDNRYSKDNCCYLLANILLLHTEKYSANGNYRLEWVLVISYCVTRECCSHEIRCYSLLQLKFTPQTSHD
jgi:hypothetical protein